MSIRKIKSRSASHTASIKALSLSSEGRNICEALCIGVAGLIEASEAIEATSGEDAALDYFYVGLVRAYERAGWGRMSWRDKVAVSKTATLADVGSLRAIRASIAITRL